MMAFALYVINNLCSLSNKHIYGLEIPDNNLLQMRL